MSCVASVSFPTRTYLVRGTDRVCTEEALRESTLPLFLDRIGEREGERGWVGEGRDGGFFVNVCIVRKYFITFGQNSRESLSI